MNTTAVAEFLKERLANKEVAAGEGGFLESRLFGMVLAGEAKLPLDKVEEVAAALDCDAPELFRLAMHQFYDEEAVRLLDRMFAVPLTTAEQMWLHEIRSAAGGPVVEPSAIARRLVRALAKPQCHQ
jgi:hypothetical protein